MGGKNKKKKESNHGFRMFWLPKSGGPGQNKNKGNKYYVSHREDSPSRSIMSGDSPNSHRNEIFDFKEGRISPAPTTSKEVAVQSGSGGAGAAFESAVLVEPPEKEAEDGAKEMSSKLGGGASRDSQSDAEKTLELDELSYAKKSGGAGDDDGGGKKMNGDFDKLDGVWVPAGEGVKKPPEDDDEDDDNCAIKCLYYSMQCCECQIM